MGGFGSGEAAPGPPVGYSRFWEAGGASAINGRARPPSDGPRVARFIGSFCRFTSGRNASQLIVLRDWQPDILDDLFRLDDADQRQPPPGLLGLARRERKEHVRRGHRPLPPGG